MKKYLMLILLGLFTQMAVACNNNNDCKGVCGNGADGTCNGASCVCSGVHW